MADIDEIPQLLEMGSPETRPTSLERGKVPITLLTGYLGAGKSTLLEYILTADHGYRIAVCMNGNYPFVFVMIGYSEPSSDFGDSTDIEAKSLTLSDPVTGEPTTSLLALPNGCLCCSVKDLGIAAIEEMVASQRDQVDWVIVELTGIADPAPIAKSFWANEEMGDLVLDGIICVVDSRNVLTVHSSQLGETRPEGESNECQKQVACADVILLNKTDLISTETLKQVEGSIGSINPTLKVHHTIRSRIPLSAIHDLRAFSSHSTTLASPTPTPVPASPHSHHHSAISTVLITLPSLSETQFGKLNLFLESLLWEGKLPLTSSPAPEILRTKGLIVVGEKEYVLQGVTDLFELKEIESDGENSNTGKVVFIGKGVGEELKTALLDFIGLSFQM
ncbi:hypothetical protein P7C73_g3680, partial [Tremellales sp. Uapishka_1]